MTTDPTEPGTPHVVLHAEQLRVDTARVAVEQVVLRRRIITEVRQVEVTLRREELEVQRTPLGDLPAQDTAGDAGPLVVVLSEEVPVVQVATRPYERVTVRVDRVERQQVVTEPVGVEHAALVVEPTDPTLTR